MRRTIMMLAALCAAFLLGNGAMAQGTEGSVHTDSTAVTDTIPAGYMLVDTVVYVRAAVMDTALAGRNIFREMPVRLLGGAADVKVHQSLAISTAMNRHFMDNASRQMQGYRVRIFFDNRQNARAESERIEKEFRFLFPEMQTYRSYANPYFKVTVGDFRTRSEAMSRLAKIKNIYPAAFLVKEDISYPPVDRNNPVYLDTVTLIIPKEEPSENVFF